MKRRAFIAGLGAATAWPLVARTQPAGKLPTIGYLGGGNMTGESPFIAAFLQRLRELGWIEDRNIAIEYRWAEGSSERGAEIATEFGHLKVDVILASGVNVALAAMQAAAEQLVHLAPDVILVASASATRAVQQRTRTIPIVFMNVGDPVAGGLVQSFARPNGNSTGITSLYVADLFRRGAPDYADRILPARSRATCRFSFRPSTSSSSTSRPQRRSGLRSPSPFSCVPTR
jgi:putative ABC transport system substrate-binding protein